MELTEVVQKVQLIEGQFTPSEAKDLISSLISEKINFHKIQRLGQVIHDENCDTKYSEERIMDLITERKIAKEFKDLESIWTFVHTKIEDVRDEPGDERIKLPAVTWKDRYGDCKSMSLFIGSILKNGRAWPPKSNPLFSRCFNYIVWRYT